MENMEFKGTKGKWEIRPNSGPWVDEDDYSGTWDIMSGETNVVGVTAYSFWGLTFEEAKANAQLISKAPEMLEMLKEFCEDVDGYDLDYLVNKAKQLIKEATTI